MKKFPIKQQLIVGAHVCSEGRSQMRYFCVRALVIIALLLSELSLAEAASYTFQTIIVPGSTCTSASNINSKNQIVGGYCESGRSRSFLWEDGTFITIDPPGSVNDSALGINNQGQIVGVYVDSQETEHGYLWNEGLFATIDIPNGLGTASRRHQRTRPHCR
jgi:probable HAF family extracellular repeat protein